MPVDLPAPGTALPHPDAPDFGVVGPAALYWERSQAGLIRSDPAQQRAVARLQMLHETLSVYRAPLRRSWLARLGLGESAAERPRGIYLWARSAAASRC